MFSLSQTSGPARTGGGPRVEHGVTQDMVFGFKLLHLQDEFSVFVLVGKNSPKRIHSVMFHIDTL